MKKKNSIARNYIFNLIYQMLFILLPLVTTPYLSRVLNSDGIGIFSYTLSIVTFFILFGTLGISLYGQRTIAYIGEDRKRITKSFWELIVIRIVTLFFSMLLFYFVFAFHGQYALYYKILLIEMIANIFDISWFFQGREEFDKLVIRNLIVKVLSVVLIFTCIKSREDLWLYFLIYVCADLFGNMSMWVYLPKYLVKVSWRELQFRNHIVPMIMLFLPQVAIQIYTVLDKSMIGFITKDMSEVGYYEQAQKVVKAVLTVLTSLQTVMNSRVASAYANHDYKQIKECMVKSVNFVWFLGVAMLCGIISVSSGLVAWYYGKGFGSVEPILVATTPIVIAIGFSSIFGVQYLVQVNKTKQFTKSVVVGSIVNFILNLIFIYCLGGLGAAISSVIAEITILLVQLKYIKDDFKNFRILENSLKPIIAGVLMFIVVKYMDLHMVTGIFSTMVQVMVGMVIYLAVLAILRFQFMFDIINQIFSPLRYRGGNRVEKDLNRKKILLYNWVQFDQRDGGGVTVYLDNIIQGMKDDPEIDLYFISSGTHYDMFRKRLRIKRTKNKYGEQVKSYTIYNSPVMFANNQFSRVDIYNKDQKLGKIFDRFIEEHGGFDIIHFNNLEGLSLSVLRLKEKYPDTKFIYSMHNYFPVCPNVYLWKLNKENCLDYHNGKSCCNCIISDYDQAKRMLKIRTLLEKFGINLQAKWVKNMYNKLRKDEKGVQPNTNINFSNGRASARDYKKFREMNVEYLNHYVDDVLCVSKRVKEIAVRLGIQEEKCHVSYIGTKFANNLQRQDIDVDNKEFHLIYLGYMNPMKGFDFLVEALSGLDKKVSKNIHLSLVCRNDPKYQIEDIKKGLEERYASVTYIDGYTHESLPGLLKGKHLGVIPVVWEDNLPQVSIEITSFGVPILSSDLGGASELCLDKDFKFKGGDIQDFQKKLTYIVKNRKKLLEFWDHYNSPTTMEEHLEELYYYYGCGGEKDEEI